MSNNDELARIVTPAVFEFVRRPEMPWANDVGKAIHEGNLTRYEFPKGYVIRSKSILMTTYEFSVQCGCAFVFHRAKGLIPRIVWQQCQALGIPARLLDEDRVVINPAGSPVDVFDTPEMQARVAKRMGWNPQTNQWIAGRINRPIGVKAP